MDDIPFSAKGRDWPDDAPHTAAAPEASHAPVPHDSGHKHVTGAAIYADDIAEPSAMVHVHIAYADFACGTVRANLSAVRHAAGVIAVLTGDDVPGENNVGPVVHDEPMLALEAGEGRVFYHGQPLFAVVATSAARRPPRGRARHRRAAVRTGDRHHARTRSSAAPRSTTRSRMEKGDPAAAIAAAPRRITGEIEIGGQEHFALEGQVAVATPGEDDDMHVVSSNQHPSECQEVMARVLGRAEPCGDGRGAPARRRLRRQGEPGQPASRPSRRSPPASPAGRPRCGPTGTTTSSSPASGTTS